MADSPNSDPTTNTTGDACPALLVNELSAGYPGARVAINNVSFSVPSGVSVAVLGPNGAGKSTLFKSIVGLIPHHTGYISLHGEDCATSHTRIGYVPQHEAIDWTFPVTVRDVVMMGLARQIGWLRGPGRSHWTAVDTALDRVGMGDFRQRQIGQLSGGQRRRVFIARALVQETSVLLLDEPFGGVDVAAGDEIMRVLDGLHADGLTLILATHDMNLASTRFDRLLLLNREVIAYGSSEEVFTADVLGQAYRGQIGMVQTEEGAVLIMDEHHHNHGENHP